MTIESFARKPAREPFNKSSRMWKSELLSAQSYMPFNGCSIHILQHANNFKLVWLHISHNRPLGNRVSFCSPSVYRANTCKYNAHGPSPEAEARPDKCQSLAFARTTAEKRALKTKMSTTNCLEAPILPNGCPTILALALAKRASTREVAQNARGRLVPPPTICASLSSHE